MRRDLIQDEGLSSRGHTVLPLPPFGLIHVKRIAGLCRGLRIPIAWPHDGLQHEKGSGLPLADIYRRLGAPMMGKHAENKGAVFIWSLRSRTCAGK